MFTGDETVFVDKKFAAPNISIITQAGSVPYYTQNFLIGI